MRVSKRLWAIQETLNNYKVNFDAAVQLHRRNLMFSGFISIVVFLIEKPADGLGYQVNLGFIDS